MNKLLWLVRLLANTPTQQQCSRVAKQAQLTTQSNPMGNNATRQSEQTGGRGRATKFEMTMKHVDTHATEKFSPQPNGCKLDPILAAHHAQWTHCAILSDGHNH